MCAVALRKEPICVESQDGLIWEKGDLEDGSTVKKSPNLVDRFDSNCPIIGERQHIISGTKRCCRSWDFAATTECNIAMC